jgi:hypothetical protein
VELGVGERVGVESQHSFDGGAELLDHFGHALMLSNICSWCNPDERFLARDQCVYGAQAGQRPD